MRTLVIDASVIVKWVIPERGEHDTAEALALLEAVTKSGVRLLQPAHWLAEVLAVVVRLRPSIAERTLALLHALELPVAADIEIYSIACRLAADMKHHVFDTLYHAVALATADGELITADDGYFRKARGKGKIRRLAEIDAGSLS